MAEEEFPQETGRTAGQRGSLKQVNATLLAQTEVLRDTQTSILSTNNLLTKSLEGQLKAASMAKLKDLETQREGGRFKAVAGGIGAAGTKVVDAAKGGIGSLQGMLGKLGGFLTPAALAALPGILAGTLLKRGIPALAVGIFADEIAEFLLGPEASGEMKKQVTRAIQGGALGSLLGKKFALIGAAAGFLIDDQVAAQMLELGKSFGSLIGADISNLDDLKGMMESVGNFIRNHLVKGLEGLNELLRGDIGGFLGIGEGEESNIVSTLGLLAGLGLVFAPGGTLRLALAAPGILLWTGGKVLGALKSIGGLATSILAASATDMLPTTTGPDGKPQKPTTAPKSRGSMFKMVGKTLMTGAGFLGGPGLLVAGAAVLGGLAIAAISDKKVQEEIERYKGAGVEQEYVPGFGVDAPDPFSSEVGLDDMGAQGPSKDQIRLQLYDQMKDGSLALGWWERNVLGVNSSAERQQKAKEASIESEKFLRALNRPKVPMASAGTDKPVIVDGSTNTTNNIGQSNTTLSAPPPSAAQNDDYSGAVNSRMNLSTSGYLN